jgi:uncharacterized protein (TIGR04255 family)
MANPQEVPLRLKQAPIVEAVFDLFCGMPDGFDIQKIAATAGDLLKTKYPKVKQSLMLEQSFTHQPGKEPAISSKSTLRGFQFFSADDKQIVQFRSDGFSFNRLAPYTVFDDYLPEIRASWEIFCKLCKPIIVTRISLRNVNQILTKVVDGKVQFENYLKICPHLPDEENLTFTGFLNNHQALEPSTGIRVNITLTTQTKIADGDLPLILDIEAFKTVIYPSDSSAIWDTDLPSIRSLKDKAFKNTLSEQCLKSYQPY